MSSETITRNDLTNILNEVLPAGGGGGGGSNLEIKEVTATGTTSAYGALGISSYVPSTATILSVACSSSNYLCHPFLYKSGATWQWYAKVVDWQSNANVTNTNVTLVIRYIHEVTT